MTLNRIARILIALAGFASTSWGAIQFDRLQADGANAGLWEWAGVAGLFSLSLIGVLSRVALRTVENAGRQLSANDALAKPLDALGKTCARMVAQGDLAGAEVIVAAARQLTGKGKP